MSTANRARVARRQAAQIDLRLTQHGELFTLREPSGGAVFHGAIGALERYLDARCQPKRSGPPPAKVPAKWRAPIALFVRYMEAMGRSPGTVRAYRLAVTRLASELRCTPAEVTEDKLIFWFAGNPHWTPETRRAARSAIRAFLVWAHKNGWIAVNLADAVPATRIPASVARPVPDDAFIEAVSKADPRTRLMMRLAAEAGLRRAEVAKVAVRDVVDGPGGGQLVVCGKGGRDSSDPDL